ncbi:MAG: polyprenyl synthetase family protein [Sandaracinaceae bacterium]
MDAWVQEVRGAVEARLATFFDEERERLHAVAPESAGLVEAIRSLTLRGGKRLRPAVLYAAYRSVEEDGRLADVVEAGAGLELLQTYLLIHDDWMDGDEERRGGPSVHAMLREQHGDPQLGASLAILAGNLACAESWALFLRAAPDAASRARALAAVLRMHEEVLVGQQLDLLGVEDVSRMHRLKTGSYTLRGPIALGAALGGADGEQREALDRFAVPLGEAFQIRDDLLGTFGDPKATGKPAGNDLRAGKRTALIAAAEARATPDELRPLSAVLGVGAASDAEVAEAMALLERTGARRAVEARLDELLEAAQAALRGARLAEPGLTMLREVAERLAHRAA